VRGDLVTRIPPWALVTGVVVLIGLVLVALAALGGRRLPERTGRPAGRRPDRAEPARRVRSPPEPAGYPGTAAGLLVMCVTSLLVTA